MVVISAALVSKEGRVFLSRQFIDISKFQIQGFLMGFSKLIDPSRQHTFVENQSARFVFQAIQDIYLVLVTTKDSNIVDDIETLRLLRKVVQHYCPFGLSDGSILKYSFQIIWAFDDAISNGHRESVTLGQLLTYAEMESAEEKIFREKQKAQMDEAKENAKRKQIELDKKRAQEAQIRQKHPIEPPLPAPIMPSTMPEYQPTVETKSPAVVAPKKASSKGMRLVARNRNTGMDDLSQQYDSVFGEYRV